MSDENTDFGNPEEDTDGIKNLRKAFKDRTAKLSEMEKRIAEYEAKERVGSVEAFLKGKNVLPEYAEWYPDADVSDDAVGKWYEKHQSMFRTAEGTSPPEGDKPGDQKPGDKPGDKTPPAQLDANAAAAKAIAALAAGRHSWKSWGSSSRRCASVAGNHEPASSVIPPPEEVDVNG